jgi:hypothetical protein
MIKTPEILLGLAISRDSDSPLITAVCAPPISTEARQRQFSGRTDRANLFGLLSVANYFCKARRWPVRSDDDVRPTLKAILPHAPSLVFHSSVLDGLDKLLSGLVGPNLFVRIEIGKILPDHLFRTVPFDSLALPPCQCRCIIARTSRLSAPPLSKTFALKCSRRGG